jgi:hypothetical protein
VKCGPEEKVHEGGEMRGWDPPGALPAVENDKESLRGRHTREAMIGITNIQRPEYMRHAAETLREEDSCRLDCKDTCEGSWKLAAIKSCRIIVEAIQRSLV